MVGRCMIIDANKDSMEKNAPVTEKPAQDVGKSASEELRSVHFEGTKDKCMACGGFDSVSEVKDITMKNRLIGAYGSDYFASDNLYFDANCLDYLLTNIPTADTLRKINKAYEIACSGNDMMCKELINVLPEEILFGVGSNDGSPAYVLANQGSKAVKLKLIERWGAKALHAGIGTLYPVASALAAFGSSEVNLKLVETADLEVLHIGEGTSFSVADAVAKDESLAVKVRLARKFGIDAMRIGAGTAWCVAHTLISDFPTSEEFILELIKIGGQELLQLENSFSNFAAQLIAACAVTPMPLHALIKVGGVPVLKHGDGKHNAVATTIAKFGSAQLFRELEEMGDEVLNVTDGRKSVRDIIAEYEEHMRIKQEEFERKRTYLRN